MSAAGRPSLLIIDDEPQIRRAVRNAVTPEVGQVLEAATAREGIDLAAAQRPDLVILDLGLTDGEGFAVFKEIRSWSTAPFIILSARHSDQEKVQLLDAGAEDYVTKPFSPAELRARVRVQLRRLQADSGVSDGRVRVGDLEIDLAGRTVLRGGAPVHLTPIEWEILRTLLASAGRPLTHGQLFRKVWNQPSGDPQQYLRVHVSNLRRKLERDTLRPRLIITEPGIGYRLVLEPPPDGPPF